MTTTDPAEARAAGKARTRKRLLFIAALAVLVAAVALVVVPLVATSSPQFFSRYHLLQRRYVNLEESAHEGIGCRQCHETAPLANGVSLIADYYGSFVKKRKVPRYFTFKPPTREACLKCHEDDWADSAARLGRIPHPAHTRVASESRDCVKCHKWTAHFEKYMAKHKEMPFSGVCVAYGCHVGTKTNKQCFDCHHVLHENGEQWKTEHPQVARSMGQNACLEGCHTVKQCQDCHTTGVTPKFNGRPIETSMKSIEKLHVRPDWTARYHGAEALRGRDRCLLCHQSEGECGECHLQRPDFHGSTTSWIGRHKKHAKAVDDPRCLECHKQVWCEKCHAQFKEME